jgi:hypothetical protein
LQALFGQALLSLAFGHDHADDLTAPGDEIAKEARRFIRQRPNDRPRRFDKVGDHPRIDRVGLCTLAKPRRTACSVFGMA